MFSSRELQPGGGMRDGALVCLVGVQRDLWEGDQHEVPGLHPPCHGSDQRLRPSESSERALFSQRSSVRGRWLLLLRFPALLLAA